MFDDVCRFFLLGVDQHRLRQYFRDLVPRPSESSPVPIEECTSWASWTMCFQMRVCERQTRFWCSFGIPVPAASTNKLDDLRIYYKSAVYPSGSWQC